MANVALMIDGENISSRYIDKVLAQAKMHGDLIIKRVYANNNNTTDLSWMRVSAENSLRYIHTQRTDNKKNTTDMQLAIETIEVALTKNIDTFVLCTSDADFTPVVHKLVEMEKKVIGMGERYATQGYVNSCSSFDYLEPDVVHEEKKQIYNETAQIGEINVQSVNSVTVINGFPPQIDFSYFIYTCYREMMRNKWVKVSSIGNKLCSLNITKPSMGLVKLLRLTGYFDCRKKNQHHEFRIKQDQYSVVESIVKEHLNKVECAPESSVANIIDNSVGQKSQVSEFNNNIVSIEKARDRTKLPATLAEFKVMSFNEFAKRLPVNIAEDTDFHMMIDAVMNIYSNDEGWLATNILARALNAYFSYQLDDKDFSFSSFIRKQGYSQLKLLIDGIGKFETHRLGKTIFIRWRDESLRIKTGS